MEKEQIKEEALKRFPYPTSDDDHLSLECLSKQSGFIQGAEWMQKESDKQWTDEDMLSAFKAGTDNETLVETGIGMYPNHQYNSEEWLKLYKQSKSNADN
jgi:hypothetical protein